MASGASVEMLPDVAMGPATGGGGEELGRELGLLIREQRRRQEEAAAAAANRDNELSIFRSGSAPPSVEGSLNAVGGLFGENELASEEELRKDPAYLEYYYSHVNRNHRLPPPVLSKEDWRFTQRLQGGTSGFGGIGDARKGGDVGIGRRAVLDQQSGSNFQNEFSNDSRQAMGSGEWLNRQADVLIGLSDSSLRGRRQKSFKDAFQGNIGHQSSVPGRRSGPASTHSIADNGESLDSNVQTLLHPRAGLSSTDGQSQRTNGNVQSVQSMASQTFASVLGTTTLRSRTPDPQLVARVPSPGLPPIGVKMNSSDKAVKSTIDSCDISSSGLAESVDLASTFQRMNISKSGHDDIGRYRKEMHVPENHIPESKRVQSIGKQDYSKKLESWHFDNSCLPQTTRSYAGVRNPNFVPSGKVDIQRSNISATNPYMEVPLTPPSISPVGSPVSYPLGYGEPSSLTYPGLSGYNLNPQLAMLGSQVGSASLFPQFQNLAAASMLSPGLGGFPAGSAPTELQTVNKLSDYATTNDVQMPLNPLYAQHLRNSLYAGDANLNANFAFIDRNYTGLSYSDLMEFQKAYERLIMQNTYNAPLWGKPGSLNQAYYSNSNLGLEVPYHINPLSCSGQFASGGPGSNFAHTDCNLRSPTLRSLSAERLGSWNLDNIGGIDDTYMSSLLEELKTSKTKSLELAEIAGHVVKFSADQFGSRFIQQKLETATAEEKNMVFEEIMPHALTLMTDVFGNYVVQKFFEHGTAAQTRELANQLVGHVLTLSLQMYGCRVIQKAIEVVALDQQTKLVAELDGHVIRCVRDQNGNHVIQKCIECVPQEAIQFIISSFYDQVVALSMHSYGCRVIQRVLEHCDDPKTQEIVMSEIMPCVRILAEDQYGNYVIQHVLEHGKPEERSAIIKQFTGQIYLMSQQKFSSNVIEKCLAFGCPEERRALVNEMVGTTDENEPLQTMMKDPFGNYVVQKALETCDDQQRELILSRIKIHLNALKKYTYGKHIVARVEKLVAAGERRAAVQGQYSS